MSAKQTVNQFEMIQIRAEDATTMGAPTPSQDSNATIVKDPIAGSWTVFAALFGTAAAPGYWLFKDDNGVSIRVPIFAAT